MMAPLVVTRLATTTANSQLILDVMMSSCSERAVRTIGTVGNDGTVDGEEPSVLCLPQWSNGIQKGNRQNGKSAGHSALGHVRKLARSAALFASTKCGHNHLSVMASYIQ